MSRDLIRRLGQVVDTMEGLYARVLPLLDSEKRSLIEMSFEKLYEEMKEKDEILTLIRKLDKERLSIQDHFSSLNDVPREKMTLKFFADSLVEGDEEDRKLAHKLLASRERIQKLIESTKLKIMSNEKFIVKSVGHLRGLAEAVNQATQPQSQAGAGKKYSTYGKNAKIKQADKTPGSIVSGHV